jgi:hypothetical protein
MCRRGKGASPRRDSPAGPFQAPSQVYTVVTNAGLRRAMEALTLTPGQTDAIVPTQEERRPLPAAVNC